MRALFDRPRCKDVAIVRPTGEKGGAMLVSAPPPTVTGEGSKEERLYMVGTQTRRCPTNQPPIEMEKGQKQGIDYNTEED